MRAIVIQPPPAAGFVRRVMARVRQAFSRRLACRLLGVPTVTLEGRVFAVRAVPLGVARELVPALLRCARRFAEWQIDESLYDDLVTTVALGLGADRRTIEALTVPLWDLSPVVECIAVANGMPVVEAGRSGLGKLLAAMSPSTGTSSSPGPSMPPAGPGSTSSNA